MSSLPSILPPVDENAHVPDSVKRAAAAADAIHKQVYGTPEPAPTSYKKEAGDEDKTINIVDATPAPLPRVTTPAGEKILLPKPNVTAPDATLGQQPPAPAQPSTSAPTEVPKPVLTLTPRDATPKEPVDDNDQTWKQKFLSSQGRLEQAHRNLGFAQEQLAQMGDEVSRLHNMQRQQPAPQAPVMAPPITFDPKDRETFGDDLLNAVARAATAAATATLQPTVEEIRNAQKQNSETLRQTMQQTSMRYIHGELDRAVPAWRDINKSVEFAQWLSLPDLYSGAVRGNLLRQAFSNGDANRVVAFFKGFVVDATSQVPVQPAQPSQVVTPAVSLATLVAPGTVKPATGSDPTVPPEKPIYTRAQIRLFYDEIRRGLWAHRPQDKAAIEADMMLAPREGRVVG